MNFHATASDDFELLERGECNRATISHKEAQKTQAVFFVLFAPFCGKLFAR
jgi:hypothetical protein